MMETAQARARSHRRLRTRLLFDRPAIRCVLTEAVVNPIFVKVGNVITHEAPQVLFVQRDHVIEQLAPAATHPSFRDSILPRRLDTGPFGLQSRGLQEGDHLVIECRITIEDRVPIRTSFGEGRTQLLDHPLRSRVTGHIEV